MDLGFEYDPETKRQSSESHTDVIIFSNGRGAVHKEFVPQGKTVNTSYYVDVL